MEGPLISRSPVNPWIMGMMVGATALIICALLYAYLRTKTELLHFKNLDLRERIVLLQNSMLWYGEIRSVNAEERTFTAEFRNQFVSTNEPLEFRIRTTDETVFIYQKLVAENGAYTRLSGALEGTLAHMFPGTRVAVLMENVPEKGGLTAKIVVYGNPL